MVATISISNYDLPVNRQTYPSELLVDVNRPLSGPALV